MSKAPSTAKELFAELAGPGPHEVLRGDLAAAGVQGTVFTPRSGLGLPAVVFGHGWLQPPIRYRNLLRHLASWGVVVACPATQAGPLPSYQRYADDLRTALDVCAGVRLGGGEISVDPARLGLAGHSTGGGSAVLAAAAESSAAGRVRAVATLAVAEVRPSAAAAAAECAMPGLHLAAGRDLIAPPVAHAEEIAANWRGPVTVRGLAKATHLGFTQGRHWSELLLDGKPEPASRRAAQALLTAFFRFHLAGDGRVRPLLDNDVKACPITYRREPRRPARAA
ncbi:MAG TPA: alpha/beta hydrolase [Pseudonocardiaceae bacterium]|jgi:dienelactone hydrolase|nr:alpha/beta hydrolase [Pseudonocardiaceae bacterium]